MISPTNLRSRVLVADDDPVQRRLIAGLLERAGYTVALAADGNEAMRVLEGDDPPGLCLLDWNMPGPTGVELCRWLRRHPRLETTHVVLVTARDTPEDVVHALEAGANDYIAKPYRRGELLARVASGARVVALQSRLDAKIAELEHAMAEIKQLRGLIPICSHCHRIRDDAEQWHRLEAYFEKHTDVVFSHSICDRCLGLHYPNTTT